MKNESIPRVSLTDWARIDAMRDEDIDFSDAPEVTEDMLKTAVWRIGGKRVPKEMKNREYSP